MPKAKATSKRPAGATLPRERPPTPTTPPGSLRPAWAAVIIVLAAALAYHNSFSGPFVFDDLMNVVQNASIRSLSPPGQPLRPPVGTGVSGRPVVNLSFALNHALHGMSVRGFHAGNLLIHAATALALFGVVRRTLLTPRLAGRFGRDAAVPALLVALVWEVHPLLTDSVSYISGRSELLVAMFMLLAMYCVTRAAAAAAAAAAAEPSRRRAKLWQLAAVCCALLGAGCKEIVVALPPLVLLYDRTFLAGTFRQALRARPALHAGLSASVLLVAFNLYTADFHRNALVGHEMSSWTYLKIQAEVLMMYLRLSFWPHPLFIDYIGWRSDATLVQVLPSALAVLALLAATAWGVARSRPAAYAGAWCFLILAPTSSLLPLPTEVATERRMYLPLMGIVALAVLGAGRLVYLARERSPAMGRLARYAATAAAAVVLFAATLRTVSRNEDYKDVVALWSDVAAGRPNAVRAYVNLAYEFLRRGQPEQAKLCFMQVARLDETDYMNRNNLAALLRLEGNTADAARYLHEALRIKPDYDFAYQNLGMVHFDEGNLPEAERCLREAVRLAPDRADHRELLARVLAARSGTKGG